jgi:hypothetical protein
MLADPLTPRQSYHLGNSPQSQPQVDLGHNVANVVVAGGNPITDRKSDAYTRVDAPTYANLQIDQLIKRQLL